MASTVVVGCAGGYVDFRLNDGNLKITIEERSYNIDTETWNPWETIDQDFPSTQEAWKWIGEKVGWVD